MKIVIMILVVTMLISCSSDPYKRELFKDGSRVFIDKETGVEFLVEHSIGDTYMMRKIPNKKTAP